MATVSIQVASFLILVACAPEVRHGGPAPDFWEPGPYDGPEWMQVTDRWFREIPEPSDSGDPDAYEDWTTYVGPADRIQGEVTVDRSANQRSVAIVMAGEDETFRRILKYQSQYLGPPLPLPTPSTGTFTVDWQVPAREERDIAFYAVVDDAGLLVGLADAAPFDRPSVSEWSWAGPEGRLVAKLGPARTSAATPREYYDRRLDVTVDGVTIELWPWESAMLTLGAYDYVVVNRGLAMRAVNGPAEPNGAWTLGRVL